MMMGTKLFIKIILVSASRNRNIYGRNILDKVEK